MLTLLRKNGICVLLLMAVLIFCGCSEKVAEADSGSQPMAAEESKSERRENIETILIFCVDEQAAPQDASAYRNGNVVDLILVMVMDSVQGKTSVLQINPDTAVSFTPPGTQEALELPLGQIYSYGSGGSDSGLSQMKAISQFLGGIPMDHYLTFTMESVAIVNDHIGGVTVALPEDMQPQFPDTEVGAPVGLSGQDVLQFLRHRDGQDISNEAHMNRQRQYMMELLPPLFHKAQDDDFLAKLTIQLGEGMATDLTLSQMVEVLDLLDSYELDETVMLISGSGEVKNGTRFYYPDENALNQVIDRLYY